MTFTLLWCIQFYTGPPQNIIPAYATAAMYFNVMYYVLNELMQDEKLGICIHFTLFST